MEATPVISNVLVFALGALVGFIGGALGTIKVFLIMHRDSIPGRH